MIKETSKELFKIAYENKTLYTDDLSVLYQFIEDYRHWTISKISDAPTDAETLEFMFMFDSPTVDDYSTGGGCHSSECHYNGKCYLVENELPTCLSVYNDKDSYEDIFYEDNMIYSIDVNERKLTATERNIYEYLIKQMSE